MNELREFIYTARNARQKYTIRKIKTFSTEGAKCIREIKTVSMN
jgi:hypothetical protein